MAGRLRSVLVEGPGSLGERSRARRWRTFQELFPDAADMRVVDLGGTPQSWLRAPVRPRHVTVVNLAELPAPEEDWLRVVQADACDLPAWLFDEDFDLVFSNSLIEHVGGPARRADLARNVHRLAPRHWLQTPYRYFPVEPHWLFPLMQFLPLVARAFVVRTWPLAHTRATRESSVRVALGVELLSRTELAYLFPDSELVAERMGPLVKSLVAVRTRAPAPTP